MILCSAFALAGCGGGSPTSGSDDSSSTTDSDSASDSSSSSSTASDSSSAADSSTSAEEGPDLVAISSVRSLEVGAEVKVEGIVAAHNYTGQGTPYIVGFWLADETGSIYVYSESVASGVQKGNKVSLIGTKAFYIPDTDTGSASAVGYEGMLQLVNPEIVTSDSLSHALPASAITEATIAEIVDIPLTTDITGNIYRIVGRYHRLDYTSYVNYSVDDLNRVDSLLAYTQCNGKDHYWSDAQDGKTIEMLIIISLGKPSVSEWRICPIHFGGEVVVTALEEAEYGAQRALDAIEDEYEVETTVRVLIADPLLEGLNREYSSLSDKVAISHEGQDNVLVFDASVPGTLTLTAVASYGGQVASKTKTIAIEEPDIYQAITLAEAKATADGQSVTVRAIVAKVTYKSSMTKQGLFLVDDTATLFVYNDAATQANIVSVSDGNKVVVTGVMAHFIKDAANAAAENYAGDVQLTNVVLDNLDTNVYSIPSAAIIDNTIANIVATLPLANLSSLVYKVDAKVVKNVSGYATSYDLVSLADASKKLPLYSQNSGADYSWLDTYNGLAVEIYVGIQNLNLRSAGSNWRGCPLQVLGLIE